MCPIKALAHIVHDVLKHGGNKDSLLCDVWHNNKWFFIESKDMIKAVQATFAALKLNKRAIDPDLVEAHPLQAGGAMGLKLHGYNNTTIIKMGRWTSLTFLQYIHNQIAHLSKDISRKMSI